jgi:nucleoside-diphosphate-sugar epimerase
MAIAVTGATGFLGGRVVSRLQRLGIAHSACPGRAGGLDLTDAIRVRDYFAGGPFDVVIHCAAEVPKSSAGYADDRAGERSLKMAENLLASAPPHIVFASSMTVYPADAVMPVREEDADDHAGGYAGYKRRAESVLEGAQTTDVTILRFPGFFGPSRKNGLLFNAAREFANDGTPELADPAPLWAAMHVDDAADLCVRAAVSPPPGQLVLNAGYDCPMSVTSTVAALAGLFGRAMVPGDAPVFQMNLTRLKKTIGLADATLADRLAELAAEARVAQEAALA